MDNKKQNEPPPPKDFYNFLIYKLDIMFDSEPNNENYKRLKDFVFDRVYLKKAIMTIPYNVSRTNMMKYIIGNLSEVKRDKDGVVWYSKLNTNKTLISNKDISVLVGCIYYIINKDFEKEIDEIS